MFHQGQDTEALVQRQAKLHASYAGSPTWERVSFSGGSGFGGMKRLWRAPKAWHCERLGEASGNGDASVAVDATVLKGHGKTWRLGTTWQGQSPRTQPRRG